MQLFKDGELYPNSPSTFKSEKDMLDQLGIAGSGGWGYYIWPRPNSKTKGWTAYYGEVEE